MDSTENFKPINSNITPRESDITARSNDYQKGSDFLNDENNGFVKNVYIHRNGDMFSSSRRFVYNKKQLRTWDAFLEDLTSALNPRTGPIRSIHTPQTGSKIQTFDEIQPNSNYVALASGEKLQMIGYLRLLQEQEAAKKRRNYHLPFQGASEAPPCESDIISPVNSSVPSTVQRRFQVSGRIKYEMQKRGKTICIFRNGDEYTRAICVMLKYSELKSMDLVLKVVGEKVILPTSLPIRRLFTMDGEAISDPDQLEDNKSYIALGHEPFVPCLYGQTLPNIICGPKKQERIRYLNSVTTPTPGKQRKKNKSHSNDSMTPKSSRQNQPDEKRHTTEIENGSQKQEKNNFLSKPKDNPTKIHKLQEKEENNEKEDLELNYEEDQIIQQNDESYYYEKESEDPERYPNYQNETDVE